MTNVLDTYPEEVLPDKVKGLAPDVHLLVGGHLDPPAALGLVRVVLRVVWSLDGNLEIKYDNIGWFWFVKFVFLTSCPSARVSLPFLQLKASTSFLARKVFSASHAFAA